MTDDELRNHLIALRDNLTSFLLDIVPDDEPWEEAQPELDALRNRVNDLIDELEK